MFLGDTKMISFFVFDLVKITLNNISGLTVLSSMPLEAPFPDIKVSLIFSD